MKRLAILGVDVTERKEAEEKLKEQAALLGCHRWTRSSSRTWRITFSIGTRARKESMAGAPRRRREEIRRISCTPRRTHPKPGKPEGNNREKGMARRSPSKHEGRQEPHRRGTLDPRAERARRTERDPLGQQRRHRPAFRPRAAPEVAAAGEPWHPGRRDRP